MSPEAEGGGGRVGQTAGVLERGEGRCAYDVHMISPCGEVGLGFNDRTAVHKATMHIS